MMKVLMKKSLHQQVLRQRWLQEVILYTQNINKSIKGMLANISEDGRVLNVSGGTAVMNDRDGYRNISRDWIQGWGQGLALAFFSQLLIANQTEKDGAL